MGMHLIRGFFALLAFLAGYFTAPVQSRLLGGLIGIGSAAVIVTIEILFSRVSVRKIFLGVVGLVVGLVSAHLLVDFIYLIPGRPETENFVRILVYYLFSYLGINVALRYSGKWEVIIGAGSIEARKAPLIVDSNVIIDGRLSDIVQTGFLDYQLIVPQFVIKELQVIADSADDNKRQRGRRGLDMLNKLKREERVELRVAEIDYPHIKDTDAKLIEYARSIRAGILTNDFNLSQAAEVQNIRILSINSLSMVLKPRYLQGDRLVIRIVKPGKEATQGVGYLDDGTMVVVENGRRRIGETVETQIVKSIQTSTGRMLFAEIVP